jgi:hypothetical protein
VNGAIETVGVAEERHRRSGGAAERQALHHNSDHREAFPVGPFVSDDSGMGMAVPERLTLSIASVSVSVCSRVISDSLTTEETVIKRVMLGMMALVTVAMFVASQGVSQPPGGREDKGGPVEKEKDGKDSPKIEAKADQYLKAMSSFLAGSDQKAPPQAPQPTRPEPAQTEPADKELAKVRSELAVTQKALTETRQALAKNQMELATNQKTLAEVTRAGKTLRK